LVIDMHRAVIEHPDWVPDELKNRIDSRYGEMSGRIYWAGAKGTSWPIAGWTELQERPLSKRSNEELVGLLDRSDAWLRRTAARLLIERDAVDALPQLLALAADTRDASVEARVCALQLIALFDPGARTHLKPALTDAQRLVQITALRMLSRIPVAAADGTDGPSAEATQMALDLAVVTEDPWLRLEAVMCAARTAGALSPQDGQKAAERLGRLAAAHADDAHLLVAISAATRRHSSRFLLSWLDGLGEIPATAPIGRVGQEVARDKWVVSAARLLVTHLEKHDSAAVPELMARLRFNLTSVDPVSELSRLATLAALAQHARTLVAHDRQQVQVPSSAAAEAKEAAAGTAAGQPSALRNEIDRPLWRKIRELARLPETPQAVRLASVELLGLSPRKGDRELIRALATESEDGTLRNHAIKAWAEQGSPECEEFLVAQVAQAGPALRPTLVDLLLTRPERQRRLLEALEAGRLSAKQLGAVELKRFVDRAQGDVKAGFEKQLGSILNSDRAAVLRDYMSCLELPGDVARGKQVFSKHCAACHRIGDVGTQVGPDISDSRVQTAEKLLTSIIDPNRAIDNNYFRFVVLTNDGRTLDGLIAEETADKVVIRGQNDQRHVIARSEIEQMKPTGVSMMPEGLESQVDRQAMADLIAFVKNWRYDSQQIPAGIKAGKK
jgi:putative heme-binding domain-containing protein